MAKAISNHELARQARSVGAVYFKSQKGCKYGHGDLFYSCSACCVMCTKNRSIENKKNPEVKEKNRKREQIRRDKLKGNHQEIKVSLKNWKFDALKIAVLYVLKEEGPHTCQQLHERIGASRPHLGTVLRILLSGGHVTHQGYPRSYTFNHVRAFKDRANDPFDIAQEQAT